ncbi:MAG: coproporphyrinogen-III oxidase family protein [Alkalispirochaetaceae bacterium]
MTDHPPKKKPVAPGTADPWELPQQQELSLYLHIPFCTLKCDYCDFYSLAGASSPLIDQTLEGIIADIDAMVPAALGAGASIPTVYIGGGTPSLLSSKQLGALLGAVASQLPGRPLEWSVEANPETLTREKLALLRDAGVGRISVGVQTLSSEGLRVLGRAAGERATRDALDLLGSRWEGRWNADLILGFDGDREERVVRDLEEMVAAGARHISVYALTLEEGTPLTAQVAAGKRSLPGEDELLALLDTAGELLRSRGLRRYEVSNYATPGEESLHNLRYWRMSPYLGIGPAAASTLPYPRPLADKAALRLTGATPLTRYLQGGAGRYNREEIDPREFLQELLLMGLRTLEGVTMLPRRLEIPEEAVEHALAPLLEEGIVEPTGASEYPSRAFRVPEDRWALLDRHILAVEARLEPLLKPPPGTPGRGGSGGSTLY